MITDNHLSWFIDVPSVSNRTGRWFAAVAAVKTAGILDQLTTLSDGGKKQVSCKDLKMDKSDLDEDFKSTEDGQTNDYEMQVWVAVGKATIENINYFLNRLIPVAATTLMKRETDGSRME